MRGARPAWTQKTSSAFRPGWWSAGSPAIPRSRCCTAFANAVTRPALLLSRGIAIIDTLHPVYEGRAFFWAGDKTVETLVSEYGPSTTGDSANTWHQSPFYRLLQGSDDELRRRLETGEPSGFAVIDELRQEGQTDYIAMVQRFGREAAIGEMDCFLSRWLTTRPGGFSDADIDALRRLVPLLGAGDQVDVAGPRRGIAGRNLSRPRRRPPRACRPHVARLGGEDPCRAVVLGHSRLHRAVRGHGVRPADPAA